MFVVAGVTGHVGSVVAEQLLSKGQKVKVIVRDAQKGAAFAKKGAEVAVGALDDKAFLTGALKGAKGFFTLLPSDYFGATDFRGTQKKTSDAIAAAVKASGVPHVVLLSSVGADLPSGTGPIKGLHDLEDALRATGVNLSAIRAGYFQENAGNVLEPAKNQGVFPSFAPADVPMPMIATRDIGALAAKLLASPPAKSEVVDLHGPSYSMRQVAEALGKVLGKQLNVVEIPQAGWVGALMQAGFSKEVAELFAEMYAGFGSGAIVPKGDRMEHGKTTIDEVVRALVR